MGGRGAHEAVAVQTPPSGLETVVAPGAVSATVGGAAWGGSDLYLNRRHHRLLLTVEHRAAPAPPPLAMDIVAAAGLISGLESNRGPERSPAGRVLLAISETDQPMTRRALRESSRMRACTVGQVLTQLIEDGKTVEDHRGYPLSSTQV